jgi:LytR cell envelope-related transcriptional attenuator
VSARRAGESRLRGCIEVALLVAFAILIGAFAASTWLRHESGGEDAPAASGGTAAGPRPDRSRIRVEVRNGSGLGGAAGRMTEFLRGQGFDVVDFGNADRFDVARTHVVDRGGGPVEAREVATALQGVPISPPAPADSSSYLDVTVVVGADLEAVLAERPPARPSGWRRWLEWLPGR